MSLKIINLSLRVGNRWILRDIDLEAPTGKIFGICGALGSGKTSLLKAIAGHLPLSSGQIFLDSLDVTAKGKARGFDLLTDTPAILWKNIFSAKHLSQGETQRAAFENFIQSSQTVALLDDPFTQVDSDTRTSLLRDLKTWMTPTRIAIVASHSFDLLASLADAVLIIGEGYAQQTGTPKDIYERPDTALVARLTGETNLIRARRISSSDAALPEFQTLHGEYRILSQPTPKSRLGPLNKDSTLAIRPEQITMSMGTSFPEDNLLRAVVTNIEFHGAKSLIDFDAGGLTLRARVFKVVGLELGTECMLGLPPDRIVVLKD
ncbi:MAG TPA: ATP-binding cassette domain-containing protein [Pyrinomonadaceae bacterium]|nr:ATP-binding cassette domain-containing protein [Acidobacteriota bacterium]HQZ97487.1 ATP-binding cassette domain-containing protein [Pyrinomonadaceae bacterium]